MIKFVCVIVKTACFFIGYLYLNCIQIQDPDLRKTRVGFFWKVLANLQDFCITTDSSG